jgi:uncharacterized membrane protein
VQRFISKYALAAHLALAAVAPLPLMRYFDGSLAATSMLWLSGFALVWTLLSPSVFSGERMNDARRRILRSMFSDPLVWVMLLLVLVSGVRALNGGIKMAYDAEAMIWSIAPATFPLLPGTVDGCGYLPFAVSFSVAVLMIACRHALGKAARMAFCFAASTFAGIFAVMELLNAGAGASPDTPAYGVYLLTGTIALAAAFEFRWNRIMLLFVFSIGANAAGLFAFSAPLAIVAFLAAELVVVGYVFFYTHATLRQAAEFKLLVVFGISVAVGVFAALSLIPQEVLNSKVASILEWKLFEENFFEVRGVLSDIAFRSWKVHPWLGSGLASFPLDVRFFATDDDWLILVSERSEALNGYWHLLAERGIVGVAMLALPLIILTVHFLIAMVRGIMAFRLPHPSAFIGILTLAAIVATAFFDVSFLRPEIMAAAAFALAVSTKSFPKERLDG